MKKTTLVPNTKSAGKVATITEEKVAILIPKIKATMNPDLLILKKMKVTKEMKIIKKQITVKNTKIFKILTKRRKMYHLESLSGLPEALPRRRRRK